MPAQYAAIAVCFVLAVLAAFQTALIFGAPIGRFAWGGQDAVLPRHLRIGSAISLLIYALFAAVLLDRAGLIDIFPAAVSFYGAWAIPAYGVLGTGLNALSRSRPERFVMTPVALLLAVCAGIVALS